MSGAVELTILGKSPAMTDANGANSGYLVRHDGFTLLLDCGSGAFAKLRAVADLSEVDAVLITHIHADHTTDLIPFAHAISYFRGDAVDRPALWGPPGSESALAALGAVFGAPELIGAAFSASEYDPASELRLGPLTITFTLVPHYVPAWACDLRTEDGTRLTFGADCGPNEAIAELAAGTDLLMLESTEGPHHVADAHGAGFRGHISAQEAGEIAARAGAGKLLLTHYSDTLEPEDLRRAASEVFDGPILLAREGDRHVI